MKSWIKTLALVFIAVLLIAGVASFIFYRRMGADLPARIDLPGGAVGLRMQFVYSWILPVPGGVVLIDAGGDAGAPEILTELKARGLGPEAVKAVLLTHAHFDHWPGVAAFPHAPVYVHRGDLALIRGEKKPRHWVVKLMAMTRKTQAPPDHLVVLNGSETLQFGGEKISVVHLPGHTAGSLLFVWNRVLFSGDILQWDGKARSLRPAPEMFSDDTNLMEGNLVKTLPELSFDLLATSHSGLAPGGKQDVLDFIRARQTQGTP